MTPNRVTVALEKYGKQIPSYGISNFTRALEAADSHCMDKFMFLPIKGKTKTLLFSIFLGGIGVDRFYIGDNGLGAGKLAVRIISLLTNSVPVLGVIMSLASSIWCIADIFITYKKAKEMNYSKLVSYLKRHPKKKPEEVQENQQNSEEESEIFENESTTDTEQEKETPKEEKEICDVLSAAPVNDKPDIIFKCPNCSANMKITVVAAKYQCPVCKRIIEYSEILGGGEKK